ncbi:MAG: TIGR00730 family Rossman fold protein [Gluconacetobacter diazotrophicus]|nr:TIGR00730 family Rossman fold protein [Gluconacetobacter diazotrophicus]
MAADLPDAPAPREGFAVAVFCGSRFGRDPRFRDAAAAMGLGLARLGMGLVYGGGDVGLMGTVADAALDAGGRVSGVIPDFLRRREVMHRGVTDLVVTGSMHERKQLMFARADAYAVLPGGLGTFDEFFEIVTWKQLGLHDKPILLVDVGGWGEAVAAVIARAVEQGFADEGANRLFERVADVPAALDRLRVSRERGATGAPAADPALL